MEFWKKLHWCPVEQSGGGTHQWCIFPAESWMFVGTNNGPGVARKLDFAGRLDISDEIGTKASFPWPFLWSFHQDQQSSVCCIVVGRRPFIIAVGPLNMCIVLYIHSVHTWYIRYVYSIFSAAAEGKKPKLTPANNPRCASQCFCVQNKITYFSDTLIYIWLI